MNPAFEPSVITHPERGSASRSGIPRERAPHTDRGQGLFLGGGGSQTRAPVGLRLCLVAGCLALLGVTAARPALAASQAAREPAHPGPAEQRPNILYIITDQLRPDMMSCAGNRFVKTPAIDSLAAAGVRFERAYCGNPVCLPSRVTMVTGCLPSRFGIQSNDDSRGPMPEEILRRSLGWLFRDAGYETAYGGKTHWPRGMTPRSIGFEEYLTDNERDGLAEACAQFLQKKRAKPFLLVASFINPHDICYLAIDAYTRAEQKPAMFPRSVVERETLAAALQLPDGVSRGEFFGGDRRDGLAYDRLCPPLPANYAIPALEAECVTERYTKTEPFREYVRRHWSDEQWRLLRWAYCRLTEQADAEIGRVLQAVRAAGLERETLIVFSSDHGEMGGAHQLEHKSVLYEEAARVPFIVCFRGVTRPGRVDRTHLVSAGLDLVPTLCDYAGIKLPAGLLGRSVRALAEGRPVHSWRDEVVVESQDGRMLRADRYKYVVYDSGAHREQLIDLGRDPGEMRDLAENSRFEGILMDLRRRLSRWAEGTGDRLAKPYLVPAESRSSEAAAPGGRR